MTDKAEQEDDDDDVGDDDDHNYADDDKNENNDDISKEEVEEEQRMRKKGRGRKSFATPAVRYTSFSAKHISDSKQKISVKRGTLLKVFC